MGSPGFHIPGYEIVRPLGAGGMATVYLAEQTSLGRHVAIKVMTRSQGGENFDRRFNNEARTMAALSGHRNIVTVFDIVQNEEIGYILMEYLTGGTLKDRMRRGLTLAEAIAVTVTVANALEFAHRREVVHRDLKPENIMFRDAATPVLTDFGIARVSDSEATRLTQAGTIVGTPTYMSPEQARGIDVDGRSDQYSLGVLFYEMLAGKPPFVSETPMGVALAHVTEAPPSLPGKFAQFQPLMDKLLAKQPDQRYPNLDAFVRELRATVTGSRTLQAELRIDSLHNSSEQLRALGFSDSQIHTATRPVVGLDLLDVRKLSRFAKPAGIAAAVLLAMVLAWSFWPASAPQEQPLDPALQVAVNSIMSEADRLIEQGQLVTPPEDNAYDKLQAALQIAPGFPPARQRIAAIAGRLKDEADAAVGQGDFQLAELRVAEALSVKPDDAGLGLLRERIGVAKLAAERGEQVTDLLRRSAAERQAGRLYGEGVTALALVRQALRLDPNHAAAAAELNAVVDASLAQAREVLKKGGLDEASRLLGLSAAWLSNEPAWQALDADLTAARGLAQRQARIDELLTQAQGHIDAGRHAEPIGNSALESIKRLEELAPGDARIAALRSKVGTALFKAGQAAEQRGDNVRALERYDQALGAQPDYPEYLAARKALQQRLSERESRLALAFGNATTAIDAHRYFKPAGGASSAREYLEEVLRLEPSREDARKLLDGLPDMARNAAQSLGNERRYDEALVMLADALEFSPRHSGLLALKREMESQREQARLASEREQQLSEVQQLLAGGHLDEAAARRIGTILASLQKRNGNDTDAAHHRERFLGDIVKGIQAADSPERLAAWNKVLASAGQALGASSPDVVAATRHYQAASAELETKERARLAAISGTLMLDAQPWARVESVVEQIGGKSIALPKDRTTPLRLTLPQGTYRITFAPPGGGAPLSKVATVEAQHVRDISAAFSTITAEDYLKRAGYAQ